MGRKSLCMYQHIVAHLLNTFLATGVTGNVTINENGDRSADYSLLAMDPETGNFTVMVICMSNKYIIQYQYSCTSAYLFKSFVIFIEDGR